MVYKIAIFAPNDSFMPPILRELGQRRCIVKIWGKSDVKAFDLIQMNELMKWADCAYFDFLFDPLPMASRSITECRIVARALGVEVYSPTMAVIDWSRIDLIYPGPAQLRFKREVPDAQPLSETVINVGVPSKPTKTPKTQFGHNIGIIATTPLPRKRLYTTIESFIDLCWLSSSPWRLLIRGASTTGYRDIEAKEYLKFMMEFIHTLKTNPLMNPIVSSAASRIEWFPHMEETVYLNWIKSFDIVISNSTQEGYHVTPLLAASYGAYPLVHRWLGSDTVYHKDMLFLSQRELVDRIIKWDALRLEEKRLESLQAQKFVRKNHDEVKCCRRIVDIIMGV